MTLTTTEDDPSVAPAIAPQRVALKQRAYDDLKRLILTGELAAGTVQSVRQLAAQLDMSKTPVHAAIERLEAEGLVTLAPQQGVVVRELSCAGYRQPLRDSSGAGTVCDAPACGSIDARPDRYAPGESESPSRGWPNRGWRRRVISVDAEFHEMLCHFLGNDEITRTMQHLQNKICGATYQVSQRSPDRIAGSYDEHKAIFEALVSGDGQRAAELANEHLERGSGKILVRPSTMNSEDTIVRVVTSRTHVPSVRLVKRKLISSCIVAISVALMLSAGGSSNAEEEARVSRDLLALYTFDAGGGDVVRDRSGFGQRLDLKIQETSSVQWGDGFLATKSSAGISSSRPAKKIVDAIRHSGSMTIEAWIRPGSDRQEGPARIVSLSPDTGAAQLHVWSGGKIMGRSAADHLDQHQWSPFISHAE